jgi:alkylhydroperoxidase/carboxymuconolactone decarboxylase family protein YurZ
MTYQKEDLYAGLPGNTDLDRFRTEFATTYEAAAGLWRSAMAAPALPPRMKELILLAIHASAAANNETAIARQVARARSAGATEGDILDVLISIVGLANHALYFAVPLLLEELESFQKGYGALPPIRADVEAIKEDFIRTRGAWHEDRERIARTMPDYFKSFSTLSTEPWKNGSLKPREREFVYIAIDCSVTHMHGPGLRLHLRNALKHGASREELLEVLHLTALVGLDGFRLGVASLFSTVPDNELSGK